jgi:hypothetical protein
VPQGAGFGDVAMEEDVPHDHLLLALNLVGRGALLLQRLGRGARTLVSPRPP